MDGSQRNVRRGGTPYGAALTLALCASLLLAGCGTMHTVSVSSLADSQLAQARRYAVLPADPNVDLHDLEYRTYAGYVHRALQARGFTRAATRDEVEVVVFLEYGVSEPVANAFTASSYGRTTTVRAINEFQKYVRLRAVTYTAGGAAGERRESWRTEITCTDGEADLGVMVPIMLGAALDHIGTHSGQAVRVQVGSNQREVRTVRGS